MKATELLGAEVVDTRGRRLGKVHDVRLARTHPNERWHIETLVVGPSAFAYRLGYAEEDVRGPCLLAALAARLNRRTHRIPWKHVLSFDRRRLTVRPSPTEDPS